MATLETIRAAIKRKLDISYTDPEIDEMINGALQAIAGGILMPDGSISPPLPGLKDSDTVTTSTSVAYVALPTDYQRKVFYVADSANMRINPVHGGDYYSFTLFLNAAVKKDLSMAGSVLSVCVKGDYIYYQGIPATATTLTLWFYRKAATLSNLSDEPEGLPAHLAKDLLKHYVLKEELGENIEDGEDSRGSGADYHEKKFFNLMTTLVRSIPEDDAEPVYYGAGGGVRDEW